jgi:hypothetical protein
MEKIMKAQTAIAPIALTSPSGQALIRKIWPPAVIACALGLTAAWASFLGYWLISLVGKII